jgi:hypothetical protein
VVGCCGNGNEPSVCKGVRGNLLTRLGTFSFQGRTLLHVLRFYRYFVDELCIRCESAGIDHARNESGKCTIRSVVTKVSCEHGLSSGWTSKLRWEKSRIYGRGERDKCYGRTSWKPAE